MNEAGVGNIMKCQQRLKVGRCWKCGINIFICDKNYDNIKCGDIM